MRTLIPRQSVSWLPIAPSNRLLSSIWQRCHRNTSSYIVPLSSLSTHTHSTRTDRSGVPAAPFLRAWWIIHVEAVQQQKCQEYRSNGKPCGFGDSLRWKAHTPTNKQIIRWPGNHSGTANGITARHSSGIPHWMLMHVRNLTHCMTTVSGMCV